jgi:sporulation protein YlmC with PRC-barrel domain
MDVVRDVLDKAVVDRNGRKMGRVDGIVLDRREGQPPRLTAILIGPVALGDRLHRNIGRLVSTLVARTGLGQGRPVRIDFENIADVGRSVKLRLLIGETAVDAVERRLRAWVLKIPGSR